MSGSYVLIAGVLFYIFLLRTLDSPKANPVKAAITWTVAYYALSSLVLGMEYASNGMPVVRNLFEPVRIATAVVQCAVMIGIFYKIEDTGDDYMSYIFWGGLGLALIFFVIPSALQQMFMRFVY